VDSWVLARSQREQSWHCFQEALRSDMIDIQGGTTPEGIHLGAMAGAVDIIERCYSGIEAREHILWFNPSLPPELNEVRMRIRYRDHWIDVAISQEQLRLTGTAGRMPLVKVGFGGRTHELRAGQSLEFDLRQRKSGN